MLQINMFYINPFDDEQQDWGFFRFARGGLSGVGVSLGFFGVSVGVGIV